VFAAVRRLVRETSLGALSWARTPARSFTPGAAESDECRTFFEKHGWLWIRGLLNSNEIEAAIDGLRAANERRALGDVATIPEIARWMMDPRIVRIVTSLFGERPTWFGDSSYSWISDVYPGAIGFHKDNADKDDPNAPDWQGPYPVLRVGYYFNDYSRYSGGLGLRDGSHLLPSCEDGLPFAVPSVPGDVIFWSLRMTHSGFVSKPRWPKAWFVPVPIQVRVNFRGRAFRPIPLFQGPAPGETRPTMFLTYARRSPLFDRYVDYLSTRRFAVETWRNSVYDAELRKKIDCAGLDLVDMSQRAAKLNDVSLNVYHQPLGY